MVVDVGCHKGGFLIWLRRYVGAAGRVYAFEPQPALAAYLDAIVRAQRWRNVVLERAALSSVAGSMMLYVPAAPGHSSPGATLAPASVAGAHHHVPVAVTTLDARVPPGERVSCIKCDCEGHEFEVFQGAERILRQDRPVLLFECEGRHLSGYARTTADGRGRTPADVFAYLQAREYVGFFCEEDYATQQALRFWDEPRFDLANDGECAFAADEEIDGVHVWLYKVTRCVFAGCWRTVVSNTNIWNL